MSIRTLDINAKQNFIRALLGCTIVCYMHLRWDMHTGPRLLPSKRKGRRKQSRRTQMQFEWNSRQREGWSWRWSSNHRGQTPRPAPSGHKCYPASWASSMISSQERASFRYTLWFSCSLSAAWHFLVASCTQLQWQYCVCQVEMLLPLCSTGSALN